MSIASTQGGSAHLGALPHYPSTAILTFPCEWVSKQSKPRPTLRLLSTGERKDFPLSSVHPRITVHELSYRLNSPSQLDLACPSRPRKSWQCGSSKSDGLIPRASFSPQNPSLAWSHFVHREFCLVEASRRANCNITRDAIEEARRCESAPCVFSRLFPFRTESDPALAIIPTVTNGLGLVTRSERPTSAPPSASPDRRLLRLLRPHLSLFSPQRDSQLERRRTRPGRDRISCDGLGRA